MANLDTKHFISNINGSLTFPSSARRQGASSCCGDSQCTTAGGRRSRPTAAGTTAFRPGTYGGATSRAGSGADGCSSDDGAITTIQFSALRRKFRVLAQLRSPAIDVKFYTLEIYLVAMRNMQPVALFWCRASPRV